MMANLWVYPLAKVEWRILLQHLPLKGVLDSVGKGYLDIILAKYRLSIMKSSWLHLKNIVIW